MAMGRSPLLAVGAAAAAGAALAAPLDPVLRLLLAPAAVLCAARFRLPAALALVAGFIACVAHSGASGQFPVREHTSRIACTMIEMHVCLADDGLAYGVSSFEGLPPLAARALFRARIEPFDTARNPGEPDYASIERDRGVSAQLTSAHVLRLLPDGPMNLPVGIAHAHAWALGQLRAYLDEPYASILAGELWGERAALAPDLRAEFQETGTVHILVTAGLHLGVVAMLALGLLRALRLPRTFAAAAAACAVWSYALFSGLHLPSERAAAMITFGLAAYAFGAACASWNAYGAALTFVALVRPQSLTSASFALSFSCAGGILLLAPGIERALEAFEQPARVREALTLTLATQIATWPLTAATFLLFAPYAALANLLCVPVVGVTMILAGLQFACAAFPFAAQIVATVNTWLMQWIVSAIGTIAALPHAALALTPPSLSAVAAYDAALAFAVYAWKRKGRTVGLCAVLLAALWICTPPERTDHLLHVDVLDVGQADAIVIRTPLGHTILVDAGGRLERGAPANESAAEQVGERVVVPFLRRSGVRRIDALILSHPHGDHAGGVAPVLRSYGGAGSFADGGQKYGGFAYNDGLNVARAENIPVVTPRAGDVWHLDDGVTLTFIGPSLPFIISNNAINDNSVAFVLQYKRFRMVFTGDAGVAAEQRFLNEGIDLHADVLKVGHHGSAYSSSPAFIAAVDPTYAIISVGRHNMFGHPAPSTIETLQRFGARVYRTDEQGAIQVVSDGASAPSLRTMLP
ncbi:MAG: DNA internalization-related competence protein ComEC/Rec2 [Candidatus Baltobacteraceae bacterium]